MLSGFRFGNRSRVRILTLVHTDCFLGAEFCKICIRINRRIQFPGIIQIILVGAGHRQNLTGFGIHYNRCRNLGSDIILLPLIQVLFHRHLDIGVDRRNNRISVSRLLDDRLQFCVLIEISILTAIHAHKRIIIILFHTAGAGFSIRAGKSQDIAGHRSVRIGTLVLILKPDALDSGLIAGLCICLVLLFHIVHKTGLVVIGKLLCIFDIGLVLLLIQERTELTCIIFKIIRKRLDRRLHIPSVIS